ncbi:hypothetical protein TSUD_383780 [Trifolium subterraneum]|uniref:Reverse transcriptase domain-containing protein n=1 Tax=Trifolium subterraneum TaxID=3900 RepID=A0A2Z6MV04_TRISU|nr:hypothetical protein TSUD_383780 [Trifolium subterraneum]
MASETPNLAATLQQILQNQQEFQQTVTQELNQLRARLPPPGFPFPHDPGPPPQPHHTTIKLEIPKFDGSNALGWIFKITQFFDFHRTPEDQRIRMASFYMEGEALTWYQWLHNNGQLQTWPMFVQSLELRFAPSQYEDPKGALFKLCQTGSIKDYQGEFESLANRIVGLPTPFYLSCFVSGLKPEIRREVQAFQPFSLTQAISLAKLQEDKVNDRNNSSQTRKPSGSAPTAPSSSTLTQPPFKPFQNSPPQPNTPPKTSTPIKRLSPQELQTRREKGLCYNCDDKFAPGHRCKRSFHILIAEPETDPFTTEQLTLALLDSATPKPTLPEPQNDPNQAQISLHALMGHTIPQTLKVKGQIHKSPVVLLIDSGSTHNFIQDRIVKQLGLPLQPAQSFQVLVGNGEELQCNFMCQQTDLMVGPHHFSVDLFVLPLSGANIVLGVQWLKTLGPVLTDYEHLTMQFMKDGSLVQLIGEPKSSPLESSLHQLKRLVTTNSLDLSYHIQLLSLTNDTTQNPIHHPAIPHLLEKYHHLFEPPTTLPPPRPIDHRIVLTDGANPVNVRPYRYPQFQKREIENQIKAMLEQGVIQQSSSAFSSPVLLVRKKDGSWRFCVDYRALNTMTVKDRFPIPAIEELLDEIYGTQWFSKLDLRSGYHQIRMSPMDVEKTAFRTHQGHYEFLVMPFGLCNAPSTFQATMNIIFQPFLRRFVIVFFDDILVYSRTLDEHLEHLETVFQCLASNQFFLKMSKCTFAQPSISYLGHIITANGFYRKFIQHYASIAHALTELLKKDSFIWSDAAQIAFDNLKEAMTKAPVLVLPNFDQDFQINTDASGLGMGAVLSQNGHPIAYFSKKFCPKLLSASTYVRELCAITTAVKKWRTYLLGRRFTIHTDQRSLRELMTQIIQTPEQQFYLAKLLGYSYNIVYKPGNQNRVADALSRVQEAETTFMSISIPHWEFLDKLKTELAEDDDFQHLLNQVTTEPTSYPHFKIMDGGHSGIHKTYGRLRENVYWEGMHRDVTEYVKACLICQQTKSPTHLPYGLLQPLPIPTAVWEDISLDFITGLPSFQTSTVILVVVDRFSKAAHFGMLPTSFTAQKVADLFAQMVFKHHGMPRSMQYKPGLWGKYLHLVEWHYNTTIHSSTGYSPFQVVFGKLPPSLPTYIAGSSHLEALDTTLTDRDTILQMLRKKLEKAQTAMKFYADKKRLPHPFKVGDLVLVKLRPYRQLSVSGKRNHKLSKRYFGPFPIIKQIGEVAFKLQLPAESKIHPVFHLSQLKPFHGTIEDNPTIESETTLETRPIAILDWKFENNTASKVLVQWSNSFPEDSTWELVTDMIAEYPELHLEDKVSFDEGRDVMDQQEQMEEGVNIQTEVDLEEINLQARPKRTVFKPKKLDDYVGPFSKSKK